MLGSRGPFVMMMMTTTLRRGTRHSAYAGNVTHAHTHTHTHAHIPCFDRQSHRCVSDPIACVWGRARRPVWRRHFNTEQRMRKLLTDEAPWELEGDAYDDVAALLAAAHVGTQHGQGAGRQRNAHYPPHGKHHKARPPLRANHEAPWEHEETDEEVAALLAAAGVSWDGAGQQHNARQPSHGKNPPPQGRHPPPPAQREQQVSPLKPAPDKDGFIMPTSGKKDNKKGEAARNGGAPGGNDDGGVGGGVAAGTKEEKKANKKPVPKNLYELLDNE